MSATTPKSGIGFLARSIRGLEWVAAAEINGRLGSKGAKIIGLEHREIHFELPNLEAEVPRLNSVDDVFLNCGTIGNVDHRRASLQLLAEKAKKVDFAKALAKLEELRPIRNPGRFDVVASFLGPRNYNRFEIEEAIGSAVARQLGAVQQPRDKRTEADISWRVHLRDYEAYIGLRLSATPLHRREYKSASRVGTLHPPVAAAMALLSGLRPQGIFLDPFCGAGTIGIEAARLEPEIRPIVSDIDFSVVALARANAKLAECHMELVVADAGRLPFDYRTVDRIVCNIPWGRTVAQKGVLSAGTRLFWHEMGRILHAEGRAVILSEDVESTAEQLREAGLCLVLRHRISLFGRWSNLSVLVPDSQRDLTPIDYYGKFGAELLEQWERNPEKKH